MKASEIRDTFLKFFESKGHTIVASSPLVPANDPTLMFTNSGMVQFKDVFLGSDKRPYVRAASVQACLRAGGKHNDLENVGYTARHHTFFEMLGNWSFGDYFKHDALTLAWELLTKVYKLPADKLWATVYIDDDEAYDIWTKVIGLPPERVVRIGDNKGAKYASDNFWMMADTGPCGPCSEIFYDHGPGIAGGPPGSPDADGDRYIEIWNNVFMQFDMQPDGSIKKLPAPCVDTGMGLERLAAILQHVHSNYEIDLFDRLIRAASRETGEKDLSNKSLRVIADHIRATAFLVSDGVIPSNEGRGYVQRRIIRRGIRHGYKLGQKKPFFHKLVADLVNEMGAAYPKLAADQQHITDTLKAEEVRFFETLANGMEILDAALAGGQKTLPGDVAFKLHDTYGFPLDLTQDVCRERNVEVDEVGFGAAMEQQKAAGRAAGKFKMARAVEYTGAGHEFTGYEHLEEKAIVAALYQEGSPVQQLLEGQTGIVVLSVTPFYAESGGQVGDQGSLSAEGALFGVQDTQKIKADVFGHHGVMSQGKLSVGDTVTARVDGKLRAATVRNHSATHLMHKALREVLGTHVQQKGSLVDADKTRFDFAHNAPVTPQQIAEIERRVNDEILANAATQARVMDIESAQKTGAMMLFGEKYGETVRVLDIGSSRELCGGTHVHRTGDIGLFKVVGESGVAAGVRRIEAVTGANALSYLQTLEGTVHQLAATLKAAPTEVPQRLAQVLDQVRALEKELGAVKGRLASSQGDELVGQAIDVKGLKVLAARLEGADAKTLRETLDKLKDKLKTAVIVLAAVDGDKVQLAAGVTADSTGKVKAGELVNFVAQQVGGKGGGKADIAMAGGTDASQLPQALASVQGWVAGKL
ncbi:MULTISPECIES: alanine--tRNA ligase [unclassified Rhizobacter]|uniref:alanine--tRNA ligase n=1 Tax=unclassified Rhizobacter TaxID=2640088 RepID=UPI0006F77A28|nr:MULTISPECIES: alanine--tRNA ligase [unclassified Rhizobacter]KQU73819.1 alanine--tRNA ligase [Rhizobacter sp. Root29]KQW11249.1 alanine--tRNA ligase [Rhizobacter sp. Root1238]KRB18194.1 alanine--tRNA ligase [Rhizobacter sp. Root16D2]